MHTWVAARHVLRLRLRQGHLWENLCLLVHWGSLVPCWRPVGRPSAVGALHCCAVSILLETFPIARRAVAKGALLRLRARVRVQLLAHTHTQNK